MSLLSISDRIRILAAKDPCSKCGGSGRIPQFGHIDEGICYWCKGSGVEPKGRKAPKSKVGPKQTTDEEDVKMAIYQLRTYYNNFRNALRRHVRESAHDESFHIDSFWSQFDSERFDPKVGKKEFFLAVADAIREIHDKGSPEKAREILRSFSDLKKRSDSVLGDR